MNICKYNTFSNCGTSTVSEGSNTSNKILDSMKRKLSRNGIFTTNFSRKG